MHLDDFDFELPPELIAQYPAKRREDSRLMVLNRKIESIQTTLFPQILDFFHRGDVLIVNDTRVIPARLLGRKESGGKVEVFLVRQVAGEENVWICLTKSSKSPRPGTRLLLGEEIVGTVQEGGDNQYRHIAFECDGDFSSALERAGQIPLPPYIRRDETSLDRERYQTVFASKKGAVAAPTAGLHFTPEILDALRGKGVEIHAVTLHVGLGTFLPVRVDNILEHKMHGEVYHVSEETARAVNSAKDEGRRVFGLGTTTTRTLEYAVDKGGRLVPGDGVTDLFIYPGFQFKIVDGLITNFHLPRSTLLMLISAFAGKDFVLSAYERAVEEMFRFFSYGDCMLIL